MQENDSDEGVKDTVPEESAHDRGRKKVKAGSTDLEGEGQKSARLGASYKDTLIDAEMTSCSKDTRGSGVFDEAWQEHITNLKSFFEDADGDKERSNENDEGMGIPNLTFSQEQYERWCAPWRNSLIVKVLGRSLSLWNLQTKLQRLWRTKEQFTLRDIDNGYFVASFNCEEDLNYVYFEGPWLVADHYLLIQRWRPNFDPWSAGQQKKLAAWVRIPVLPLEFFNAESLRLIGNLIGKTLKVDSITYLKERGRFARICVELDLAKRLIPAIRIFGKARAIEYEGLHLICFHCGVYGHHREQCPDKLKNGSQGEASRKATTEEEETEGRREAPENDSTDGMHGRKSGATAKRSREVAANGSSGHAPPQPGEELGVWNLVRRTPRKPRFAPNKVGSGGNGSGKLGLQNQVGMMLSESRPPGNNASNGEGSSAIFAPGVTDESHNRGKDNANIDKRWARGDRNQSKPRASLAHRHKSRQVGPNSRLVKGPMQVDLLKTHPMTSTNPFAALKDMDEETLNDDLEPHSTQADNSNNNSALDGFNSAPALGCPKDILASASSGPQSQTPTLQVSQ